MSVINAFQYKRCLCILTLPKYSAEFIVQKKKKLKADSR